MITHAVERWVADGVWVRLVKRGIFGNRHDPHMTHWQAIKTKTNPLGIYLSSSSKPLALA